MSGRNTDIPLQVSIVIPALNEESNIESCLACLEAQTLPSHLFEVILCDNGSTDRTLTLAHAFESRLQLRIISITQVSISELRNSGAALATGFVLGFLDADCMTEPNWLEEALAMTRENTLWGAHYLIPKDATWVGRIWFQYQATAREGPVSFLPASCLFIIRNNFFSLGGFASSVETSEDVELCIRARSRGMDVIAYPALAVYHQDTPRTLTRFYRQNRWHGTYVLRIFLANLPSVRNLPLVALTIYMFVMFWATILVPAIVLPRHILLAILPIGLLILPPLLLALVKTIKSRTLVDAPALFVLYFTYLLARAAALTHLVARHQR